MSLSLSEDEPEELLRRELDKHLSHVPLLSLHCPMGWDFEPIGLVTAQSVAGTGLFSDVGSFFTDVFGLQSGMFSEKLRGGEVICKKAVRLEALKIGWARCYRHGC